MRLVLLQVLMILGHIILEVGSYKKRLTCNRYWGDATGA